jgi:hypothetical protein
MNTIGWVFGYVLRAKAGGHSVVLIGHNQVAIQLLREKVFFPLEAHN